MGAVDRVLVEREPEQLGEPDPGERVEQPSPVAFAAIYREHAQAVFTLLTRLIGPDREREDLMQVVFLRLHSALPRFRGDCTLLTLIYRITTRVAIDHMRRRRPVEICDQLEDEIDPSSTPVEQATRREEITRALAMLARLKPAHRVAFVLREVMGLSHEEVARIVDVRPATARMRASAAKRTLAKLARTRSS